MTRTAASGVPDTPLLTPPLVLVDRVSKSYPHGGTSEQVLSAASMELVRGEVTSLMGPSGSGKSTLLSLIAGLTVPDSGAIVFDGNDVAGLDDVERARLRARRIGIVLQSGNLIPFLTAVENVELAIDLADGPRAGTRAADLLAAVGLAGRLHHLPSRMSGGEAQRASVAVALANRPDLLLADEVTGELDSSTAEEVMEVILGACRARSLAVLFTTHNPDLAAQAGNLLRLENGEVCRT